MHARSDSRIGPFQSRSRKIRAAVDSDPRPRHFTAMLPRSTALALLASLAIGSRLLGAENPPPPPQKLDPVIVNATTVPLLKLDLGYHLHTARFGAAAVTDGTFIYVIGG